MPSKFDRISFVVSFPLVLFVTGGILWSDIENGMWKSDLTFLAGVVLFIILGATALWVGYSLRGKIHPTRKMLDRLMLASIVTIVSDGTLVVLAAATIGCQPWLLPVIGSILGLGVTLLLTAVFLRGSMWETR